MTALSDAQIQADLRAGHVFVALGVAEEVLKAQQVVADANIRHRVALREVGAAEEALRIAKEQRAALTERFAEHAAKIGPAA